MGRFLLGSTVVMLFPAPPLAFNPAWAPARPIRLGEAMANYSDACEALASAARSQPASTAIKLVAAASSGL